MVDNRWTSLVTDWAPMNGGRPRGRPLKGWRTNLMPSGNLMHRKGMLKTGCCGKETPNPSSNKWIESDLDDDHDDKP